MCNQGPVCFTLHCGVVLSHNLHSATRQLELQNVKPKMYRTKPELEYVISSFEMFSQSAVSCRWVNPTIFSPNSQHSTELFLLPSGMIIAIRPNPTVTLASSDLKNTFLLCWKIETGISLSRALCSLGYNKHTDNTHWLIFSGHYFTRDRVFFILIWGVWFLTKIISINTLVDMYSCKEHNMISLIL